MLSRKGNMILKVDRQGFLTISISGQKVMVITVIFGAQKAKNQREAKS